MSDLADAAPHRVVLFSKPSVPGRVKTRLAPRVGADGAARLHRAFLEDVVAAVRGEPALELVVAWAPTDGDSPADVAPPPVQLPDLGVPTRDQGPGDLGQRLLRVLSGEARGGRPVAAIGSDRPELEAAELLAAFGALDGGADVAIGPARDGGYWALALAAHAVRRELFEDVAWGGPNVLETTLERCARLGLVVRLLDIGEDCDTPQDLERLVQRLQCEPSERCPATRAALADLGLEATT